jgi:hypothetical protein
VETVDLESELIALIDGLQIQWLLDPASVGMAARLNHRFHEILIPAPVWDSGGSPAVGWPP